MTYFLEVLITVTALNVAVVCMFILLNVVLARTAQFNFVIAASLLLLSAIGAAGAFTSIFATFDGALLFLSICAFTLFIAFQIVNMLTTSIRLKILAIAHEQGPSGTSAMVQRYSGSSFVEGRLRRLESLGQIERQGDDIVLSSSLFYWLSRPVYVARFILRLDGEATIKERG